MSNECLRARQTVAGVIAGLLLVPVAAAGQQTTTAESGGWTPARTADGQPDLQGFYTHVGMGTGTEEQPATLCPGGGCYERVWSAEPKGQTNATLPMGVIDPPDEKIPLQPWAAATKQEYKDNQENPRTLVDVDTHARCLQSGVPRTNWAISYVGYQFIQGSGFVALYTEYNHQLRIIPLDGRPHLSSDIRLFGGDSIGHWEGNTLVVDTTNIAVPPTTGLGMLDMHGTPFTDAIHVVERFTIVDPDTIAYEATVEDPKAYTRPWTTAGAFVRAPEDYEVFEYACHEGNHSLENITFAIPRKND